MKISSLFFAIMFGVCSFGQITPEDQSRLDELKKEVNSDVHDSLKVFALMEWESIIYYYDFSEDSAVCEQLLDLCLSNLDKDLNPNEKKFFLSETANAYNLIGLIFQETENLDTTIHLFNESIRYYELADELEGKEGAYINLGNSLYGLGYFDQSLDAYLTGAALCDQTGNMRFKSAAINGVGTAYLDQDDYVNAKKYYYQELDLSLAEDDEYGLLSVYINLGNAFTVEPNYDSALYCYNKGLMISKTAYEADAVATLNHNIGSVYLDLNQLDSAEKYLMIGLQMRIDYDPHADIVHSYNALSEMHFMLGNYGKSVDYGETGWKIAEAYGFPTVIYMGTTQLHLSYEKVGRYKDALLVFRRHIEMRDSIMNADSQQKLISKDLKYQYNQQKMADSLAFEEQKNLDELAHKKDIEKEEQFRYFLYAGLGFVLILGAFAYRGYRRKKADNAVISEQKELAEQQKEMIEEAHQEITDSIAYAKRIQSAILPPTSLVNDLLNDAFVLYKPKDVVAGDFYWMEKVGDQVLFAAADCTGHGVPGAMVSVVCNGALNRSVREFGLTKPGEILDKSREIVIQEFEKSEEEVKDGMDIALCSIKTGGEHFDKLNMTPQVIGELQYAGANNPLWIIRNNELLETKADKQPIGKFAAASPFTTHNFQLQKGDVIYIFSDGYVDQFGGDKGKKFKAKALREYLLSIHQLPMQKQKVKLDGTFEAWRGTLEQIDDVCFIGLRIT